MQTRTSSRRAAFAAAALVSLGGALLATGARPAAAQIEHATQTSVDLTGPWLMHAGDNIDWRNLDTRETDWKVVQLPGAPVGPGFVWYRKHFVVPSSWLGDSTIAMSPNLYLHLGNLRGAAEIYVNGFGIDKLGNLPSNNQGKGLQSLQPTDSVVAALPITVGSATNSLFKYGADNVIAIRLYTPDTGADPSAGKIALNLPTADELYHSSVSTTKTDQLFNADNPVKYDATFTNNSTEPAALTWQTDLYLDNGDPVPGYTPTPASAKIKGATSNTYTSDLSFGAIPGFFTFTVNGKMNDQTLPPSSFVAGWNTAAIKSDTVAPADYGAFWDKLTAAADAAPLSPQLAKDPSSTPAVSVYRVTYAGIDGQPARAWLAMPTSLPASPVAILHIPKYEGDPTQGDVALASQGYVVMDLITTAQDFTAGNAEQDYMFTGMGTPSTYSFYAIEGNALRAARLLRAAGAIPGLSSAPRLVLWGESAGGGLALDTAALLKQGVAGVVAISPFFSDMSYDAVRNAKFAEYLAAHVERRADTFKTLSYYDTVNAAPKVVAPTFVGLGLMDKEAVPFAEYATINALGAKPTVDVEPTDGHIPQASETKAAAWVASTVK